MFTKAFKLNVTHKTIHIDQSSFKSVARPASFLVLSTIHSLFHVVCGTSLLGVWGFARGSWISDTDWSNDTCHGGLVVSRACGLVGCEGYVDRG